MEKMDMIEGYLRANNEDKVTGQSLLNSAQKVIPVATKAMISKLAYSLVSLPILGGVITYVAMSDIGNWVWAIYILLGGMTVGVIMFTIYFVIALTSINTMGSMMLYRSTVSYLGVMCSMKIAQEQGNNVHDLQSKLDKDYQSVVKEITSLIAGDVTNSPEDITNSREEFDTTINDLSSLVHLRTMSKDVNDEFTNMGVENIVTMIEDNDDDTVRSYISEHVGDHIAEKIDISGTRELFKRLYMLEEINKFRQSDSDSWTIPDSST